MATKKRKAPHGSELEPKKQKPDEGDDRLFSVLLQIDFFAWLPTETFLAIACTCKLLRDRLDEKGPDFFIAHLQHLRTIRGEKWSSIPYMFYRFARMIFTSYASKRCAKCHTHGERIKRYKHIPLMYLCGKCDPPFLLIEAPRAMKRFQLKKKDLAGIPSVKHRPKMFLEADVRSAAFRKHGSELGIQVAVAHSNQCRQDKLARELLYPRARTEALETELAKKHAQIGVRLDRYRDPQYLSPLCTRYIYETEQGAAFLISAVADETRRRHPSK
jgi:hypothetical protein